MLTIVLQLLVDINERESPARAKLYPIYLVKFRAAIGSKSILFLVGCLKRLVPAPPIRETRCQSYLLERI